MTLRTASENYCKIGGIAAILGAALLAIATVLHPLGAEPDDAPAAFAEYALDPWWTATHLGQLAGLILVAGGLLALTWHLAVRRTALWPYLGAIATVISVAIAAALQAVDGIALKAMVDRWAQASPAQQPPIYEAAFAVRQIEIGLASVLAIFLGLATLFYGLAQLSDSRTSKAIAWLGIVSGAGTLATGLVQAHLGFAGTTMAISMPSSLLLIVWIVAVGVNLLRARSNEPDQR